MKIEDPDFAAAIAALDGGDAVRLQKLLRANPRLLTEVVPVDEPPGSYFATPRLLWFVAENPIRNRCLPENIVDIADLIIAEARRIGAETISGDIDVTLGLVVSGLVPRECGCQRALSTLLVGAGAKTDAPMRAALAHRELEAVRDLLALGAERSLEAAAGLRDTATVARLAGAADKASLQFALMAAACNGAADAVRILIAAGADPDARGPSGGHAHAVPLHMAVYGGGLRTVRALVEGGASCSIPDTLFDSTPLGWARHFGHREIADYLQTRK